MKAIHLRCCDLEKPLGLGSESPHFSWHCEGGITQTAYRIRAELVGCAGDRELLWDSGFVQSARMRRIPYEGRPLKSREKVVWSVTLRDESGAEETGEEAFFEIGLLSPKDWQAQWITGDYKPKKGTRYPVDCFRKIISVRETPASVRLYAAARGVYAPAVDGVRIEDFILAPGITDYRKRIQYQTWDLTKSLEGAGEHTLELFLGDGWYRGSSAAYGVTEVYGQETSVIAQLEISYRDGSRDIVSTDGSFAWSNDGPLRFADLKDGEDYDARRMPSCKGMAKVTQAPKGVLLCASDNVPVREMEHFAAAELTAEDGTRVFDFGQNLAGYLKLSASGPEGAKIRIICGEILDEHGHVDLSNIQDRKPEKGWNQVTLLLKLMDQKIPGRTVATPRQEIHIILGEEELNYKTMFTVFGFRYAEIRAEEGVTLRAEDTEAIAVYSAFEETGSYRCSNELVNRLVENTRWSMKSNFLDIPTDCPTRERLGWTGDAQIFFNTGAYLGDISAFFRKWLRDMEDAQYKDGTIPAVFPFEGVEMMYKATGVSVGWADAVYLIPYRYYLRYGDVSVLQDFWGMIRKYTDYLLKHLGLTDKKAAKANPENAYTYEKGVHLGEWLEPEEFRDAVYGAGAKHPEECTAYLYLTMKTVREIAVILGDRDYAEKLRPYEEGAKRAYFRMFIENGSYETKRQAKLVRPLALGLLDEQPEKETVEDALVKAVTEYRFRVGTGFLSTPFLLPVLTEAGHADLAYRMLENTEKPGWLSEVAAGATTIWENWEGDLSHNHYSPGAVCEWLFDTSAGIRVEGARQFCIRPVPGGTLTHAEAVYLSPYGRVASSWDKTAEGTYIYRIEIPANTTAEIVLPDGRRERVSAGVYSF